MAVKPSLCSASRRHTFQCMKQKALSHGVRRVLGQRVFVTVSLVVCLSGTLVGTGVLGERVEESSGGALAADATLLAPAGPAFTIWSVIYAGLVAYTVWQWLPAATASVRLRGMSWTAGISMILNATWLLVTQQGWIWGSVLVIVALLVALALLVLRLDRVPATGTAERVVVDGTFGLYLGWVAVATCANITAAAVATGIGFGATAEQALGVVVVLVAGAVGLALAVRFGGRLAIAAAMVWGLAWIAVGRIADEPASVPVGIAALVAAAVVLLGAIVVRRRTSGASRGGARGRAAAAPAH